MEIGTRAQFDVYADGELIASRSRSMFARVFTGFGWPDPEAIISELSRRLDRPRVDTQ